MPETLTFAAFAARYCARHESTPDDLKTTLNNQRDKFSPVGWMLLECQQLDSSRLGSLTILPYGPNNTFKAPPTQPVSPRGLASDTSVVVALLPTENLPKDPLTVGALRAAIAALPDSALVSLRWADGPPGDNEPGAEVVSVAARSDGGAPYLAINVRLFYLNEADDEEEEDEEGAEEAAEKDDA
jgi:hypothetical protein